MDVENREFMLCCNIAPGGENIAELQDVAVLEAHSSGMKVMRHRLRIDESILQWEDIWYKDEGGRDKCIEIPIRLEDSRENIVNDRNIKLKVSLVYADTFYTVTDQSILKLFLPTTINNGNSGNASTAVATTTITTAAGGTLATTTNDNQYDLWTEDGLVKVRLRIEDVSKNHQGQNFRVKIAPDTINAPSDCDVMAALSPPITVRSKRNKRRAQAQQQPTGITRVHSGSTLAISGGVLPHHSGSSTDGQLGTIHLSSQDSGIPPSTINTDWIHQLDIPSDHNGVTLREALSWISECRDTLRDMEWTLIGYEQDQYSRAADPGRPLWNIKNPNVQINHLLKLHDERLVPLIRNIGRKHLVNRNLAPDTNNGDTNNYTHGGNEPPRRRQRIAYDPNRIRPFAANDLNNSGLNPPELSRDRKSVDLVMDVLNQGEQIHRRNNTDRLASLSNAVFDHDQQAMHNNINEFQDQHNQLLAPPDMMRGVSSLFVGNDQGGINRNMSTEFIPPSHFANATPELAEQGVCAVIAKHFISKGGDGIALGFPAFDVDGHLIGLYREIQAGSSTQIVFVPAADAESGLEPGDISRAASAYKTEVEKKSDSVHSLDKHGDSIDRLKEAVAIYHWSKEAFTGDLRKNNIMRPGPTFSGL